MLNPYNLNNIENYSFITRKYLHNLKLSRHDILYIKKILNKNETYKLSTTAKKNMLYEEFISWYKEKFIKTPDEVLNFKFINFKNTYSKSINKKITKSLTLQDTLTRHLCNIKINSESSFDYLENVDFDYNDILSLPNFMQHLKLYLLSSLYFDLYAFPLNDTKAYNINNLLSQSTDNIRESQLYEKLSETYLYPFFKLSLYKKDTDKKTLCYNSRNIFDSISIDVLFKLFYNTPNSIYPLDKKYFYARAHKNTQRPPLEQYLYNDFLDLLKSLSTVLTNYQSPFILKNLNKLNDTPKIVKEFFNHQIAEFILNANFITYISYYFPEIKLKNSFSLSTKQKQQKIVDYMIPLIIKIAKIPLPTYRTTLFDILVRNINSRLNNDTSAFLFFLYTDNLLDNIYLFLKEGLNKFYKEIINNCVEIKKESIEKLLIKEIERSDYVLFSKYKNYVVPKQWFDIAVNCFKDIDDLYYTPSSKNNYFIEKTANSFSQMFLITNLAYNYGFNPPSNNEYLSNTIYFLDKRFESTLLLGLFKNFLSESQNVY
ncbi:Uncharacterised protein [Megamonas hypermegale]|uniref:Uncharacterized protein n=1 Tax=Megamonas hypermegale TaxID=158847 RepID=A0A378PT63_9FIRM|nr:hypothetical protein [Megamonas hypermegale]STY91786.1 Uncharacterised protein [Megamonas hypermegale]